FFRRGPDLLGAERAEIVLRRQKRAAAILEEPENAPALATLFGGFPDRYFADNSALRIANHVRLMRARRKAGKHAMIDVDHHERLGVTEMVLAARDVPGLLAEVAGVLYANRVEVLDAAIYTRHAPDGLPTEEPEALDIFRVRDAMGRAVTDEARWQKVREDLESVLSGRVTGEALVASRPRGESVAAWRTPAVPTELKIDNDVSRDFTVLEVVTEDRPGTLYAISRTLFIEGLDIHRSKIATEANRAIDVFYVRDKATLVKITDPARQAQLRRRLLELLARR
ncbi:MAG TPA: hypothetical protein VHH90_04895, partial [Polyangia bacterium]|nr:hypothetical protein [Polyangia bacterium]